jgi:hypothetical protein
MITILPKDEEVVGVIRVTPSSVIAVPGGMSSSIIHPRRTVMTSSFEDDIIDAARGVEEHGV